MRLSNHDLEEDTWPPRTTARDRSVATFMGTVYFWMGLGVTCTALTAIFIGTHPMIFEAITQTWVYLPILLIPFVIVLILGTRVHAMNPIVAGFWYLFLTSSMGAWVASIVVASTEDPAFAELVGVSLFTTSAMFVGMAIFGWTTRKDLQGWGTFFLSALTGLLFALIANLYFHSEAFQLLISSIGVLLFSALIAFDVQKAKQNAHLGFSGALCSALDLYLDFLNLFLHILNLLKASSDD